MTKESLIGKHAVITYLSGFVIDGVIEDVNDSGVIFKTPQLTSFISFRTVKDIRTYKE
jgi:hypothetical protein